MHKMTCIIVDDEPLARTLMADYASKTPFLELRHCLSNAIEAQSVLAQESIDLIFLDIQMPELNGMEFSKSINQKQTKVIFTTAFDQYAVEGYSARTIDYLLKPISYSTFLKAAQKALEQFALEANSAARDAPDSIVVKADYRTHQIKLDDIFYIEALKDYVKFYLSGSEKPLLTLMSLSQLEERLPPERFMRVHRSFIVQLSKIESIERSRIIFSDQYIPVSDKYKEAFATWIRSRSL